MTPQIATEKAPLRSPVDVPSAEGDRTPFSETAFRRMIAIERKRTERSREPFLLMLLEAGTNPESARTEKTLDKIMLALQASSRETDVIGWYKDRTIVGSMFTGLATSDRSSVLNTILARVGAALQEELSFEQLSQISFSFHFFPDNWDGDDTGETSNPALYPDLFAETNGKRAMFGIKRMMDIAGSLIALMLCAPLFAIIAAAIKATSPGPVFFRQDRVGQHGRRFTFLKFRSMQVNNDHSVHREYVKKMIAGQGERISLDGKTEGVFKLAGDRRITPVGNLLRRTSLDELPQFLNVLWGDMSIVGPRPPIPYELAAYQTWHRRRLLEVKPGITGLWQINGRSRVTFDDMVRMDLQYATTWSPWLDLLIVLRTPAALIKGAY